MWANNELRHFDFNDLRLNDRFGIMLDDFTERPAASIPEACKTPAATKGAYRFFDNEKVTGEKIREGFCKATIETMEKYPSGATFLFPSDATNLVFTHREMKGIGVLRNQNARGLNLHTTLAVTEDKLVLGMVDQVCWGRKPEDYGKRDQRRYGPIEKKESYRWLQSFRAAQKALPDQHQGIFLGDRGADLYELFLEPRKKNMDLLIRALHNRIMPDRKKHLFDELKKSKFLGTIDVAIPRSGKRKKRIATLELHAQAFVLYPPAYKKHLSPIRINAVLAKEVTDNPDIANPVCWRLLTTLPIGSVEEVSHTVTTYAKRWIIERYHYTLKQGCKVEELQLEEADRVDSAVALYTIVASRIMYLTYLARIAPKEPCTAVFSDCEWKAMCCYANKTSVPPNKPPSISKAVKMIAQMGGFLGRKGDGEPGVKVIWRGMRVLEGAAAMYKIFNEKDVGNG